MRAVVMALLLAASPLGADPAVVGEALDLELGGRLGEALDRYRAALVSEQDLVQDEAAAKELTVRVLVKAAHLCIDLGYGEEAAQFAARLSGSKNPRAQQEAAVLRSRLARAQTAGAFSGDRPAWIKDAALLPSAADAWGVTVQDSVRIQLGAFKDWANALTLIDMLREKGWAPFTEVRPSGGDKLHVVYVVSRQPAQDRARLEAQGLLDKP